MQTEALPLVTKFKLLEEPFSEFPKGVPWVRYCGKYKGLTINILCPGKDATGVDSVGTVSTSLVAYASIVGLKPDLVINAGTAGGFKEKSACIGDVFVVSDVAFKAVHFLSLLEDQKVWNSNLLKWASGLISGGDNLKKIDRTYRNIPWRPIARNYCIPKC